jgi:predicted lipoprotein with Yx(FWY)xxD motif
MSTELRPGAGSRLLLRIAGAALLFATAGLHLDLYLTGYRTIPTIGWLFLLQVIAGFALGAAVLVSRSRLVAAAGAGLAISTLGGYLLTVQFGLFGFREVRTTAGIIAGILEVAAFAVLGVLAAWPQRSGAGAARPQAVAPAEADSVASPGAATRPHFRTGPGPRPPAAGAPGRGQRGIPHAGAAVAGVSVVALALLGGALAAAGGPVSAGGSSASPAAGGAAGAGLQTARIGGATVLTNASGRTLYWFAPDTAGRSACYGSCAAYWPPVPGHLTAGPGVTGKLGMITRTGGAAQETYDGRPLYTYIGDSGPGQAHGNNLNLNGGLWHEVTVGG